MIKIDKDGTVFLLNDDDGRYRYKLITDEHGWEVLIRDDGYRLHSIYVGEKPTNEKQGEREWEMVFEYKRCEAPGQRAIVEMIMAGAIGKEVER